MYDVIKPGTPPDEAVSGTEFEDGRAEHNARRKAVSEWEDARDRVIDAVRGYVEEVDDGDEYYHVRAVVPFRVRAYKHELDAVAVERVEARYGKTVSVPETDGFVDIESDDTFRAIPIEQRAAYPSFDDSVRENTELFARRGLESTVFKKVCDGTIQVPITVDVWEERLVDEDGDVTDTVFDESEYPSRAPVLPPTETVEITKRVGTATYLVDGIVPPDEWDGGDE